MRLTSSTAILTACLAASASSRAEVLPFITDDYPKALALARAEKKPIFLETWAPW